ncbi:MAG: hypothetical protein Q7V05_11450 [Methanoregula sp.]|nr:hypothetical protein [Methanoregula sp.]
MRYVRKDGVWKCGYCPNSLPDEAQTIAVQPQPMPEPAKEETPFDINDLQMFNKQPEAPGAT